MLFSKSAFKWIKKAFSTPLKSAISFLALGLIFPFLIFLLSIIFPGVVIKKYSSVVEVKNITIEGVLEESLHSSGSFYSGLFLGMIKVAINDQVVSLSYAVKGNVEGTISVLPDTMKKSKYESSLFINITKKIGIKNILDQNATKLGIQNPQYVKANFTGTIRGNIYSYRGFLITGTSGLFIIIGLCLLFWAAMKDLNFSILLVGFIYALTVFIGVIAAILKKRILSNTDILEWSIGVMIIIISIVLLRKIILSYSSSIKNYESKISISLPININLDQFIFENDLSYGIVGIKVFWRGSIFIIFSLMISYNLILFFNFIKDCNSLVVFEPMFSALLSSFLIGIYISFIMLPSILFLSFLILSFIISLLIPLNLFIFIEPLFRTKLRNYLRLRFPLINEIIIFAIDIKREYLLLRKRLKWFINSFLIYLIFLIFFIILNIYMSLVRKFGISVEILFISFYLYIIAFTIYFIRDIWQSSQWLKKVKGDKWNRSIRRILIGSRLYMLLNTMLVLLAGSIFIAIFFLLLVPKIPFTAARQLFIFANYDPNIFSSSARETLEYVFSFLPGTIFSLIIMFLSAIIIHFIILMRINFVLVTMFTFILSLGLNFVSNILNEIPITLGWRPFLVSVLTSITIGTLVFIGDQRLKKIFKVQVDCPNPECSFSVRTDMKFCPACGTQLHFWDE